MKIAYFDCPVGAAGDMLLGALLDCGLPLKAWLAELKKVDLPQDSYKPIIEDVKRSTIASKKVSFIVNEYDNQKLGTNPHNHDQSERTLFDITNIINQSQISNKAKSLAQAIFERLAESEGSVHGIFASQVHFHEVGAIDSILDIVGFAIAYDLLGIECSTVSPLPLGSGTIKTRHGELPVPGPAVLALLSKAKAPIRRADIDYECLTPTGAAILTTIAQSWGGNPGFRRIDATGYGAGDRDPEHVANVCRILIGEPAAPTRSPSRFNIESIVVLETNLDDLSPQLLSFATGQLLQLGALDAFVTPCVMKKGRSGHLLTVLCRPLDSDRLQEEILLKTSTLGVRKYEAERMVAERKWQTVNLNGSPPIRIKVAYDKQGNIIHSQPEYEDCANAAAHLEIPLERVFQRALEEFNGRNKNR